MNKSSAVDIAECQLPEKSVKRIAAVPFSNDTVNSLITKFSCKHKDCINISSSELH